MSVFIVINCGRIWVCGFQRCDFGEEGGVVRAQIGKNLCKRVSFCPFSVLILTIKIIKY